MNLIGFEQNNKMFWTERIKHARSIVGPGFTNQYQKLQQNRGDHLKKYQPKYEEILQCRQLEEVVLNYSSSEDEETDFVHEHNLKVFQKKLENQKNHTLSKLKKCLSKIST